MSGTRAGAALLAVLLIQSAARGDGAADPQPPVSNRITIPRMPGDAVGANRRIDLPVGTHLQKALISPDGEHAYAWVQQQSVALWPLVHVYLHQVTAVALVVLTLPLAWFWRWWTRWRTKGDALYCRRCGYCLTGSFGPGCPECGLPLTSRNRVHWSAGSGGFGWRLAMLAVVTGSVSAWVWFHPAPAAWRSWFHWHSVQLRAWADEQGMRWHHAYRDTKTGLWRVNLTTGRIDRRYRLPANVAYLRPTHMEVTPDGRSFVGSFFEQRPTGFSSLMGYDAFEFHVWDTATGRVRLLHRQAPSGNVGMRWSLSADSRWILTAAGGRNTLTFRGHSIHDFTQQVFYQHEQGEALNAYTSVSDGVLPGSQWTINGPTLRYLHHPKLAFQGPEQPQRYPLDLFSFDLSTGAQTATRRLAADATGYLDRFSGSGERVVFQVRTEFIAQEQTDLEVWDLAGDKPIVTVNVPSGYQPDARHLRFAGQDRYLFIATPVHHPQFLWRLDLVSMHLDQPRDMRLATYPVVWGVTEDGTRALTYGQQEPAALFVYDWRDDEPLRDTQEEHAYPHQIPDTRKISLTALLPTDRGVRSWDRIIELPDVHYAEAAAITPDGDKAYAWVVRRPEFLPELLELDLAEGRVLRRLPLPDDPVTLNALRLRMDPEGKHLLALLSRHKPRSAANRNSDYLYNVIYRWDHATGEPEELSRITDHRLNPGLRTDSSDMQGRYPWFTLPQEVQGRPSRLLRRLRFTGELETIYDTSALDAILGPEVQAGYSIPWITDDLARRLTMLRMGPSTQAPDGSWLLPVHYVVANLSEENGQPTMVKLTDRGFAFGNTISDDGRYAAYRTAKPSGEPGTYHIRDMQTDGIVLEVDGAERFGKPMFRGDGRYFFLMANAGGRAVMFRTDLRQMAVDEPRDLDRSPRISSVPLLVAEDGSRMLGFDGGHAQVFDWPGHAPAPSAD